MKDTYTFCGDTYIVDARNKGLYTPILKSILGVLYTAQDNWGRVLMIRFDLHHKDLHTEDSKHISKFFKNLIRKLERAYNTKLLYVWAREVGRKEQGQHYHCALFKNGAITGAFAYAFGSAARKLSAQDAKAVEALNVANPDSIRDNLEYGGYIYKNPDGTYGYTTPLPGTDQGFSPSSAAHLVPKGAVIVGDYHTHADYSLADPVTGRAIRTGNPALDDYNSDQFSGPDLRGIAADAGKNSFYRGYLGTPSGTFRAYDPVGGKQYIIK